MNDSTIPVTTIFSRVIRAGHETQYEEWLAGISRASSGFEGSRGTTILRPAEGREEYVAITQFETQGALDKWLESPEREDWLSKLTDIDVCREEVMSLAGMERWFTLQATPATTLPPRYKTAVLVLMGLYPLVLALDLILGPFLVGLPKPAAVLISLVISVAMMVWVVLPRLTKLFEGWLHPTGGKP